MASCVDQAHHVVQTAVKQHCGCVLTDSNALHLHAVIDSVLSW